MGTQKSGKNYINGGIVGGKNISNFLTTVKLIFKKIKSTFSLQKH